MDLDSQSKNNQLKLVNTVLNNESFKYSLKKVNKNNYDVTFVSIKILYNYTVLIIINLRFVPSIQNILPIISSLIITSVI